MTGSPSVGAGKSAGIADGTVTVNGIDLYVTEAGSGPPVILCHGFPELSYSWRHQLPALAEAGYHVVAPDQRGYGRTTRPAEIEAYDIHHLTGDLIALLDHLGEEQAVFVGHDWGSIVVWNLALLAPERVRAVVGMSVPFVPRPPAPPTTIMRQIFADNWFYMLYFQEPGIADADLGADPATTMRRFLCGIDGSFDAANAGTLLGERDGRGMVERMPEPGKLPDWITQEELDHFVRAFSVPNPPGSPSAGSAPTGSAPTGSAPIRTAFTGPLNWYRNLDRNWELTPELDGARVTMPAGFIAGAADPVLMMNPPESMRPHVPQLRTPVMIDGAGHWVQQEKPAEVNRAMLDFLGDLDR